MEAPPLREGAFSPEAAYYIDKLARKEEECNEITAQFNKYKVKTKVRFDQLRHEISNILHEKNVDPEDEQHHPAMLLISLNETQFKLEEAEKLSLALRSDVERQQVHINDQIILIKNLEDQLRVWEESEMARERRRNEPVDLERVQQQMMYKDERIVELNSVILDKERQILDLQEACRSASEVATSKKEAMRIVQKKFDEMEKRTRREASTETDDRVTGISFDGPTHAAATPERAQRAMQQQSQQPPLQRAVRTSSPGRAVHVVTKNGCNSPPPLDPSELDDLPGTSKLAKTNVDGDSSHLREKKQRKRVTFALPQAASREDISRLTADADTDEITEALVNLTAENDRLRGEVERVARMEEEMDEMAVRVAQAESAVSEAEREARHASLKARAVAQARIKELEDRMATQNALGAQQIDRLQVETETLRSTRDWEVEQNARMREQLAHTKEKLRQLREELDASAHANRVAEKKLEEKEALVTSLVAELEDAESLAVFLEDQKHQILDDVDQLKDIIKLHEEQINLLEADNLIYETRVGHLREELGVSKVNQRDHIKSKAFHTKLQMVNKEKEQIDRKANDERLRTKALHAKVQILEAENERLMARLCEVEMAGEDTSSLDAACKQLQGRMEEAEAESARVRAEFEARIKAADFATDSLREECDKLRAARDSAEQQSVFMQQQQLQMQHELQQTQLHLQHLQQQQPGPSSMQQVQQLQQAADSSASLDAALRLAASAQETLTRERDELAERVHVLGGENFELTRRTEEAEREVQRLESELSRLSSRLRESSESAAAADAERAKREERRVEREEELMDLRGRVAEREATVERMETELKRIRSELDHAHLSMAETAAVKKEVQHLQQQLEIEREAAATKWQQVMVQLKSYEELASNSGWDSRKTSIDETATVAAAAELRAARAEADAAAAREELHRLQQTQHMHQQPVHQLQHVQPLQQEVARRAVSMEDEEETVDRHELDVLRARVEELESEVELSHELNVESGRTVLTLQQRLEKAEHEKRLLESLTVEFSSDIDSMREAAAAAPVVQPEMEEEDEEKDEMRRKIEEMEEEATLSAELHVEMGRTVQALEGRIREMEMERRLHEMMSVELTTELHDLRQLQQEHLQQQPSTDAADETAEAAAEQEAQLQLQLEEEKRQRAREQQAARDELHRLQLALHAAEDAKREVARQLAEKEQTESLVRATAATFDAVAAATGASGSSSDSQLQPHTVVDAAVAAGAEAEQEEERATLVQENVLLREAVYQNVRHSESVTSDVARLLELKEELEKAVEALRGEIWSLNGQLKASVLDRENLQDRVIELDTKIGQEKRRADLLDVELAEQVELRENAQRQAAEAENESNRRLAECAEMDGKREDLEKAYALLAGYYSQLQEAYNVLYTQQQQHHANLQQERMQQAAAGSGEGVSREDRSTQTEASSASASPSTSAASVAGAAPSSSSSRRAMAEAYASRLAALRELSVQLTKSVLATELATLESELDNSITSIEGLSNDCPEAGASVDSLLDAIIQDYDGSSAVSPDARAKIASVHAMLRAKISEVERVHSALREQRGVCTALEQRLTELEAAGPPTHGIGALGSPGGASSTAPSELEERIEECEALRAHVEQLQEIISRYVAREEAARLATREADVDSLFRANAELAHENVRLQNELDEEKGEEGKEEQTVKEKPETTSSSTQTHAEKDFDEAELELIKEELEAERAERRKVEKRIIETEKEMSEQQEQLEETIVDLTMQLQQRPAAAPAAQQGGATAAEREELETAAATAAAEAATLRADLDREKERREEAERELERKKEEVEEMKTEMQLKEADSDETKQKLQQERSAKIVAEKMAKEAQLQQAQLQEEVLLLQEKKEKKEDDGWGEEGWGEDEKEEEPATSSQELADLRSQLQQEKAARAAAEEQLQSMQTEKLQLQEALNLLHESEKRVEVQPVQIAKEDDGWGEEWGEGEEKEEEPTTSSHELEELRSQLQQAADKLQKVEAEKQQLQQDLTRLQEADKLVETQPVQQTPKEDDGWGEEGWGEEEEKAEPTTSSQELEELRSQLQQAADKLQRVEGEKLQLQQDLIRLQDSEKRVETQPVQQTPKEDDGWGEEGWGEEEKEKPQAATASDSELAEIRDKLEWERTAREEAEDGLKKMEEEKKKMMEEMEKMKRLKEEVRRKLKEAEEREVNVRRQLKEMEEKREKERKKEDDGWGEDAWGDESKPVDNSYELLLQRLQVETQLRIAAERKRAELEREKKEKEEEEGGTSWGEEWGEQKSPSEAELVSLRMQLGREREARMELQQSLSDYGPELVQQLREEIEALEEENRELEGRAGGAEGEEDDGKVTFCKMARRHKKDMDILEADFERLKEIYVGRLEDLESMLARTREKMINYEHIIHDKSVTLDWMNQKFEAMENGTEIPPEPVRYSNSDPSLLHDGWLGKGKPVMVNGREVYNTMQDVKEEEVPMEEEVQYKRNHFVPEDPDEVSALYNALTDFIDEAADLQEESKSGEPEAIHKERIRLRHIVKEMAAKLQELEDEYYNEGGHLKEGMETLKTSLGTAHDENRQMKIKMKDQDRQIKGLKDELVAQALQMSEQMVLRDAWLRLHAKCQEFAEKMERLENQNGLLKDSETRLTECLDTANTRVAELEGELARARQPQTDAVAAATAQSAAQIAELQQKVTAFEAVANAKETRVTILERELAEAVEAKKVAEQKLERFVENAKKRKAATAAGGLGTSAATAATRSYTGGSRRTSTASSVWNEEIDEEPEVQQTVRVDQGQLEQQVLLEAYRSSLRDLLERVSEYLSEAESRDRSTAVTIDCLQLSIDHVTQQLEMGKKRGARTKWTTAASEPDSTATPRTDDTAISENVVTTRESMTESMEDEYMTANVHSAVSSSDLELAEEERRHSLIGRSSPAHSPASSAHIDSIVEAREESRLEAGGAEEDETQSEGEEEEEAVEGGDEVGVTIQKELDATRADLSSLRDGLSSFVREMGGWMHQVQLQQSEKDGEREEMDHLRTEHSQLEMDLERAQVDREVMETELEQANQAIWQLQQAAKTAAATAAQLEQRVAAAEEAAAAAREQLGVQLEEGEAVKERHERERGRLREQADELARMLAAADAAAAASTAEAAAAREATRAAKRERDQIESELSAMLEEAERMNEQLEEDLRRKREEAQGAEVRLARMEVELSAARMEGARQSEALQQSAAASEDADEKKELVEKLEQMQKEMEEKERRIEELKEERMVKEEYIEALKQKMNDEEMESRKKVEEMKAQFEEHESMSEARLESLSKISEDLQRSVEEARAVAESAIARAATLERDLDKERQQFAAHREAASEADFLLQESLQQLQQQLQQAESDKTAAAADHTKIMSAMERQLQQSMSEVETATAAVTQMQMAMDAVEQQARLDQAAAEAAEETNRELAARVEQLEEQLQQSQLAQPSAMEERARADLEEDIARMEMELAKALERVETAEESTTEANERAAAMDTAALAARQEVAILRSELERVSFEQSQLLRGSDDEDGPGGRRETSERVRELERAAVEMNNEMGQMLEDLRSAEERAAAATQRAAAAAERVVTMENTVAELRSRLDESLGETESLRRSMREVHHLEAALQQARAEQSQLASDTAVAREQRRAMEEERDTALTQLAEAREQLTQRTEQAIRATANRNESMSRMIEMEQQMNAVAAAAAAAGGAVSVPQLQQAAAQPASRRVSFDLGSARDESPAVAIEMPEEEASNLTEGEEENGLMDELLPRSTLVFASTPSPNVLDQLRSWLRRQARQSRALRGNRALMPYVRYAGALYVVFLQLAFIHCWFF